MSWSMDVCALEGGRPLLGACVPAPSSKGSPEPPEVVENDVPAPGARCCDGLQADSPYPSIPAVGPRTVATVPVRA